MGDSLLDGGWPIDLGLAAEPVALDDVLRAIAEERRSGCRPTPIEVLEVHPIDEDGRLLDLTVRAEEPLPGSGVWQGATVRRSLLSGGEGAWSGIVGLVEPEQGRVLVELRSADPPTPGPAELHPFDFLQAPHAVLTDPRFEASRRRLQLTLAAAAGRAQAPERPCSGVAPAWQHSWVWVWGPPGTGKTYTIGQQVVGLLSDPDERVLVLSTTHRAVDAAAMQAGRTALGRGVSIAELARGGLFHDVERYRANGLRDMLPVRDDAVLARLQGAQRAIAAASTPVARARAHRALGDARDALPPLQNIVLDSRFRAVFATAHAGARLLLGSPIGHAVELGRSPFTTVVIDEAGLVSRAVVAVLALLGARRVVLVGDPRQLSPISRASRTLPPMVVRWLARSALDHLRVDDRAPGLHRLSVQYRMHPQIREVVSTFQYDGALADAPKIGTRTWPGAGRLASWPRAIWYVADEHPDLGAEGAASGAGPGGRSRVRVATRAIFAALVDAFPELREHDGLFISPFAAQARAAQGWLAELGLDRWRASTVHAQQGAEASIVVFDTVHTSSTGWTPADWRGLINVGLSRAQHLVLVVAARAELERAWLRGLRMHLDARALGRHRGGWVWRELASDPESASSLFAAAPAPPARVPAEDPERVARDPDKLYERVESLGAQIQRRRSERPVLSSEQRRLVNRDLADAGPRLVRGVAGSGKSLVLAHWVVRTLRGLGFERVAIVFGNQALRGLLERLLADAWSEQTDDRLVMPWERVHLIHVGELLTDLRRGAGLPAPDDRYDYEAQAAAILASGPVAARFPATFIDEAQDFGHGTLQLLIDLTEEHEGRRPVLIFYDNAQNLYGRARPVWSKLGIDMRGRSDVMRESFRSTRPIVEVALNLLHPFQPLTDEPDLRELVQQGLIRHGERGGQPWWYVDFCSDDGEMPRLHLYERREDEIDALVARVRRWIAEEQVAPGDVRILAITADLRHQIVARLTDALRGVARVDSPTSRGFEGSADAVVVTTPHSFKGYEAEIVYVPGIDRFGSSDIKRMRALYVALTRARSVLYGSAVRSSNNPLVAAVERVSAQVDASTPIGRASA